MANSDKLHRIRDCAESLIEFLTERIHCDEGHEIASSALVTAFCWSMDAMGKSPEEARDMIKNAYDQYLSMKKDQCDLSQLDDDE